MALTLDLFIFIILVVGWSLGKAVEVVKLPGLVGMTLGGILLSLVFRYFGWVPPSSFSEIEPFIKSFALIVILLRAGLGISRSELNQAGWGAILMAFVPCMFEAITVSLLLHFVFGWELLQSGMAGFMLAAVSPAVVVPSMLELKAQGKETHGVITTILAGASADNAIAITFFTALSALLSGTGIDTTQTTIMLPISILGGVALGLVAGFLMSWWFHHRHEHLRATEKSLLLILMALALVRLGNSIHLTALLGVMVSGFVLLERSPRAAHEIASKLGKIWIVAQILLFVLIGLSLRPEQALATGFMPLVIIGVGLVARSLGVFLALAPTHFNIKQKLFCVVSYFPKATVQAAVGGIALAMGLSHGQEILSLAIWAILITAPLGPTVIRYFSLHLLD